MNKYYISERTCEYLWQSKGKKAGQWLENYDRYIEYLTKKWKIKIYDYEERSRFGAIYYCSSEKFGKVVLKIIPNFSERLYHEIICYNYLPYSAMCKMLDYDYSIGAILLKYIYGRSKNSLDFYKSLFDRMNFEKKLLKNDCLFGQNYWEIWLKSIEFAKTCMNKIDYLYREKLSNSITLSYQKIDDLKSGALYYIHGDAHWHNIVGNTAPVLIDPIGYQAPFEIEYARFIGTYVREKHLNTNELVNTIHYFVENTDFQNMCYYLGIDVTLRACNTFLEGNSVAEILDAIDWADNIWTSITDVLL